MVRGWDDVENNLFRVLADTEFQRGYLVCDCIGSGGSPINNLHRNKGWLLDHMNVVSSDKCLVDERRGGAGVHQCWHLWYFFWNTNDVHMLSEAGIGTNGWTGAFAKVVLGEIQSHDSYCDWMFWFSNAWGVSIACIWSLASFWGH